MKKKIKTRLNRAITAPEVRLIGADGTQHGVVKLADAVDAAKESNLDLVEISPTAKPPVCRVMDFGKYRFDQEKKHKKKSKQIQVKEIKLRPGTDEGDYQVKLRKMVVFLEAGNKVKVTLRYRGREMVHQELGRQVLVRIQGDLEELGTVEQMPKLEGRQIVMIVAPKK